MFRPPLSALHFFLPFALLAAASAQETVIHQVTDPKTNTAVDVVAMFTRPAPRGYLPLRVTMANHEMTAKSVTLSITSATGSYGESGSKLTSSFYFDSPADKVTEHDILVPLITVVGTGYTSGSRVTIEMSGSYGGSSGALSQDFSGDQPAVLLSEKLYTPNASSLDAEVSGHAGSYRGGAGQFSAKFDAKLMPDDWRAYSGYDSLLITEPEWTAALPGARSAIIAWVRMGGQLVVYSQGGTLSSMGIPSDASSGSVVIKPIDSTTLDAKSTVQLVTTSHGVPLQQKALREDFSNVRGLWPLQVAFGSRGFNYAVFIVILIAFGVVVGPVNLFVFAKSGRRHRLFITTPLISLAASLLLIALILLQDGFGGKGVRRVLMEVRPDNSENAAYIHQEQFSRTGVLTGAHFTLTDSASMSPVPIDGDNRWARLTIANGGNGSGYSADFHDGKLETSGDWFQSRSEQGHILDAVVPTRGRIERTTPAGSPQLLSTFDFPLQTLFYHDSANQWWRADNVQPGTRFEPVAVGEELVKPVLDAEGRAFGERNRACFEILRKRQSAFVALTKAAPGVETYSGIKWSETTTVITGPVITP